MERLLVICAGVALLVALTIVYWEKNNREMKKAVENEMKKEGENYQ